MSQKVSSQKASNPSFGNIFANVVSAVPAVITFTGTAGVGGVAGWLAGRRTVGGVLAGLAVGSIAGWKTGGMAFNATYRGLTSTH